MSGPALRLAGYAALFELRDGARDRILPGAFAATLAAARGPLPLLWEHRPDQVVGQVEYLAEDTRGLRVLARIDRAGSRAATLVRGGGLSGLSFGYRVRSMRQTPAGRDLHAVDLFEVSLVAHPLQPRARIHLLSSDPPLRQPAASLPPRFSTERTFA